MTSSLETANVTLYDIRGFEYVIELKILKRNIQVGRLFWIIWIGATCILMKEADLITEEEKGMGPHCWLWLTKMFKIEKKNLSVYLGIVRTAVDWF